MQTFHEICISDFHTDQDGNDKVSIKYLSSLLVVLLLLLFSFILDVPYDDSIVCFEMAASMGAFLLEKAVDYHAGKKMKIQISSIVHIAIRSLLKVVEL